MRPKPSRYSFTLQIKTPEGTRSLAVIRGYRATSEVIRGLLKSYPKFKGELQLYGCHVRRDDLPGTVWLSEEVFPLCTVDMLRDIFKQAVSNCLITTQ